VGGPAIDEKRRVPHYTADVRGNRYSPLDQINASNFNKLEIAWRYKTDNLGPRPEYKLEGTPLMVKGVLYTTGGTRRSVIALDAKTGETIWTHSLREGKRAAVSPRQLSGRGVSYWTDGRGDERIVYVTTGYRLVELNAKTGALVNSFGTNGILDLKVGAVKGKGEQIDLETGEIGVHSTPAIARDVVIIGSAMREGANGLHAQQHEGARACLRRADRQATLDLPHHPAPGRVRQRHVGTGIVGDQWQRRRLDPDQHRRGARAGVPAGRDADVGFLRRPSSRQQSLCREPGVRRSPDRQRKWFFQFVHHPLWNFDNSSAPLILDINVGGRPIKAVAVPSKQAYLYVFDRVTGQPVWPIEEKPVPQSDVPGEKTSRTQPFPTKPPPYGRNYLKRPDDVIDSLRSCARRRSTC
jgi:quinoprotein glucose dehydrogenase